MNFNDYLYGGGEGKVLVGLLFLFFLWGKKIVGKKICLYKVCFNKFIVCGCKCGLYMC